MRLLALLHSAVFGLPTLTAVFSVFLILNFKTRFSGVLKLPGALKAALLPDKTGERPVSSVCLSLSATVGTGNIVGVAGAIGLGGPGAVFWMWVSAVLAMSVKFFEVYVSCVYKKGGSAYSYIYAAIKSKALRCAFYISGLLAAVGIGNLTQTNAAATAVTFALRGFVPPTGADRFVAGVFFALFSLFLLKREITAVRFCERFLPVMAVTYLVFCLSGLFLCRGRLPYVFSLIIKGAFCPRAVTGGAAGSVFVSMRAGVARGIFSNEAGLSTAALAYEKSTAKPYVAALFGSFEVFIDTVVLCTLTALFLLSSGVVAYGEDLGAYTVVCAFMSVFGKWAAVLFCVIICFFAFSSVIGWGVYARRFALNLKISPGAVTLFYCALCLCGAALKIGAVWQIAEISSIFMMAINCYALLKTPVQINSLKNPSD